jgi:hypothetical protein
MIITNSDLALWLGGAWGSFCMMIGIIASGKKSPGKAMLNGIAVSGVMMLLLWSGLMFFEWLLK